MANANLFIIRNLKRNSEVKLNGLHNLNPMKGFGAFKNYIFSLTLWLEKINYFLFKKIELPQIEFVLTTKCTLQCKHCANFIPTIESQNHTTITFNEFKKDIDNLCGAVSKINNLLLLGGEPLLIKELPEMFKYVAQHKKIKNIWIVTNGTLLPNEELIALFKEHRKKSTLWISNYSNNSELKRVLKNEKIITLLKQNKINYVYNEDLMWDTVSMFKDNGRNIEENKHYYKNCIHPCVSVIDGEIHVCPRSSTFKMNNVFEFNKDEIVNLRELKTSQNLKQELIRFYSRDYFKACNFCNFHEDMQLDKVIPAIQIGENNEIK